MEIYKQINNIDFPNYEISDLGNIRNMTTKRILKFFKDPEGYLHIELSNQGKTKKFSVHRLVAQTWIPNPDNKPQVNHKKGIRHDNRVTELEWNTRNENVKHSHIIIRYKKRISSIYNLKVWESAEEFFKALLAEKLEL